MKRRKAGTTRAKPSRGKVAVKRDRPARVSAKTAPSPSSDLQRELNAAREQLAATSEILHLMSGSQGDLTRVFKSILANATRLTQANFGILTLREGDGFRLVATHNAPRAFAELRRREPVIRPAPLKRVAATKQPLHIPDLTEHPSFKQGEREAVEFFELTGVRTLIVVPMLKDEEVIGTVATYRREVQPFTDRQIDLIKTFAAQAVVAIENTRLLKELRESLEGQTATSDILRAIASAPGDAEGSLRKIAETTARLFDAVGVSIRIAEGDAFKLSVGVGQGAEQISTDLYADPAKRPTVGGRNLPGAVIRGNRQIHVPNLDDVDAEMADWPGVKVARANGIRTMVGTPLRTKGRAIGALIVYRNVLQPFEAAELQLLQSFADQAVIAIENARLFEAEQQRTRELTESLSQQTATADVLKVISRSTFDLKTVLSTLVESASRLCRADQAALFLRDGDVYRMAATYGFPAGSQKSFAPLPVDRTSMTGRVALAGKAVHVHDVLADPEYRASEYQKAFGYRTNLGVPLLRDGTVVGVFALVREQVEPFTDKQIELVTTFADQAVIAIENARLFEAEQQRSHELAESLEQQTAIGEILRVISNSPSDVKPVLDTVAEHAARICEAQFVDIAIVAGDTLQFGASYGNLGKPLQPIPLDRSSITGRSIIDKQWLQDEDQQRAGSDFERGRDFAVRFGHRTILSMPLIREGRALGAILLRRTEVRPFAPNHIAPLQTFADQAAIAIENVRLFEAEQQRTAELTESLEQQTATSEVLQVISSSPGDLQPVFDAVLENAARLCSAQFGNLLLHEDGAFRVGARHNMPAAFAERFELGTVFHPGPLAPVSRAAATRDFVHIVDLTADEAYRQGDPPVVAVVDLGGARSMLVVPMLKEGETIGALSIFRQEVSPFTEKQIALVENFAAQAVIAIENARLLSELRESLEQQTATADVLGVINASRGDLQPVFEAMVEKARRLCGADAGHLALPVGDDYRSVAVAAMSPEMAALIQARSYAPGRGTAIGRALAERQPVQIADIGADEEHAARQAASQGFIRTILGVPLLRQGEAIGAFGLSRRRVEPFTDRQIDLVRTFADQAVIAIENVRLLEAEQQRTHELAESLEQQTATADVLRVISSSPGDLGPVFAAMLANAVRICGAKFGTVYRRDGESLHLAAAHNTPPALAEARRRDPHRGAKDNRLIGRMLATKSATQIEDAAASPGYLDRTDTAAVAAVDLGGARTCLAVPMLKDNDVVGSFTLMRDEVRPFTDKQIELVANFASQAVIAIENARLLSELRESLEQQTATSKVLEVISRSKFELQPILQSVVDTAARLCRADAAVIFRLDSGLYRFAAGYSLDPAYLEIERQNPIAPGHGTIIGRAAMNRQVVRIDDAWSDPLYEKKQDAEIGAVRSMIGVPLMREGEPVGVIGLARSRVEPFSDREIDLVATFADQAVIAIENVRLFEAEQQRTNELTESLEQQTATSEVLQVISSSPGDLEPVFATMLENATRICQANFGVLVLNEAGAFRIAAMHNVPTAYAELRRRHPTVRLGPGHPLARVAETRQLLHIADIKADVPKGDAIVELAGARSMLLVPILKEEELIGTIAVYRQEVRPFTNKQIALVENFAAQAVIAIENTRLLSELRERTDDLGRSVGELRALGEVSQAVNSTLDLETVLSTIVTKAVQLSSTDAGAIYVFDDVGREFHLRATYGMDRELIDALSKQHIGLDESNIALVMAHRDPVQIADLREDSPNPINEIVLRAGFRARLTAPLLRGDEIVGMLVVRRRSPGAFAQNTVDLIKTFAAQSVLAIQNARLFHQIDEKSRELEIAGQHKSQFLANMSHELRTPLNAIIGYSEILQEEAADGGDGALVPDLKKIEGAGRHLLGLINDILDLSKVEAGKMDVFLEDVEIAPLLEEVRTLIVPLAEKNGNTLELRLGEHLGTMHTDRTKLKQSLLNVLSNGSKFTENGRLTLVAERYGAERPMVRFAVSDTGIGMTEDQLGRLFQAFSQADASTTKKYGGTGLGLAISRQFCQLLGGDITVTSKRGEGSTFTITLPARSDEPAQISPADAPGVAANGDVTTVLIVDDDAAARELLTANLKGSGYRLIHAKTGEEALQLARSIRPDAITLDVMMPKPDGWEVLSALKADPELADIPVVMVSVAPDRGIGLSLGAVDVLTKPVDRARLTALIHRLVRRDGPVLVVEDDANTREMMRHTIEKLGLATAEAVNGRRALTWLAEHAPPAMILLDLMMPEMDGFEFLDAMSANAQWREIPVVVVTAKQLSAAERERLLRQARKVMEKATTTRIEVAVAIAEAVRRRPARAAAGAK